MVYVHMLPLPTCTVDRPAITTDPTTQQNIIPGTSIMLTVQANGSELTYQWQRNGMNLTDGAKYSGSTTASLRVVAVMRENERNFTCVVTNAVDSITSNAAEMTLRKCVHACVYMWVVCGSVWKADGQSFNL